MTHGGGGRGQGRHKRDCGCDKCQRKQRPVDGNLARKIKARIKAEEKWLLVIELATEKARHTGHTSDLRHALEYLDDRDLGRPVDTVNHLHDKPIDLNVSLSLGEGMKLAMQKAEERLRKK
jgi:hypothetical protein